MIAKRPSIFIYTFQPDRAVLREVCAGIEENGVFFEVFERERSDPEALAHEAANDSMMGAGIGICGRLAALQMKGLPKEKPVDLLRDAAPADCRRIGANSARAIKKMPLLQQ